MIVFGRHLRIPTGFPLKNAILLLVLSIVLSPAGRLSWSKPPVGVALFEQDDASDLRLRFQAVRAVDEIRKLGLSAQLRMLSRVSQGDDLSVVPTLLALIVEEKAAEACPEILSLLGSDSLEVFTPSAYASAMLGCDSAVSKLIEKARNRDTSEEFAVVAAHALARLGGKLIEAQGEEENPDDAKARVEAVKSALTEMLLRPSTRLRAEAAGALSYLGVTTGDGGIPSDLWQDPEFGVLAGRLLLPPATADLANAQDSWIAPRRDPTRFSAVLDSELLSREAAEADNRPGSLKNSEKAWQRDTEALSAVRRSIPGGTAPLRLPGYILVAPDRDRLPWVEDLMNGPMNAPIALMEWAEDALNRSSETEMSAVDSLNRIVKHAWSLIYPIGNRNERSVSAIEAPPPVHSSGINHEEPFDGEPGSLDRQRWKRLHDITARLIDAVSDLEIQWRNAVSSVSEEGRRRMEELGNLDPSLVVLNSETIETASKLFNELDPTPVLTAQVRLFRVLDEEIPNLRAFVGWSPGGNGDWVEEIETALGTVRLYGPAAHEIRTPALLIIDFGGSDSWTRDNGSGDSTFVHLYLDLEGNDTFYSADYPGLSGAVLGTSILMDFQGDDIYSGSVGAQGAAVLGSGIHLDMEGNDRYYCERFCQGAALFGVGILHDRSGNDLYEAGGSAQGFGSTRGTGILLEGEGNDSFHAGGLDPDEIRDPSHFISLAQGFGIGLRPEEEHGAFSGGIGLLIELNGNDRYEGDVLAQGLGVWFGMGAILDFGGEDSYSLFNYGQGMGMHAGVGLLLDLDGGDRYKGRHHAMGSGLDRGMGILFDAAGDDHYTSISDSLGSGVKPLGLGILVDHMGNDDYTAEVGLGYSRRPAYSPSLWPTGLFFDREGDDRYMGRAGKGRDGFYWIQNRGGLGVDGG